jgi:hypothetical protein
MDVIAALQDEENKLRRHLDTVLHAIHLLGNPNIRTFSLRSTLLPNKV